MLTALLVGLGMSAGLPLGALPEMLLPLAFAAILTAFTLSLLLFLKALVASPSALAPGGNSGERSPDRVGVGGGRWGCLLATLPSIIFQAIPFTTFSWDGSSTHASVPLTSNISVNCGLASLAGYAGHG